MLRHNQQKKLLQLLREIAIHSKKFQKSKSRAHFKPFLTAPNVAIITTKYFVLALGKVHQPLPNHAPHNNHHINTFHLYYPNKKKEKKEDSTPIGIQNSTDLTSKISNYTLKILNTSQASD